MGSDETNLSGKTALVTGAASGIGQACAQRLADAGADVLAVDIDPAVETVATDTGGRAVIADLADETAIARLPTDDVDILVNNAGIQHVAPINDFPPERFRHIMRVMVEAPFLLLRSVLPGMYHRGFGRIVNISSVHGQRASAYKSAYVTAKHALEGLSKVAALEGAAHNVTSNCVDPAYVRTPLVERQIEAQSSAHGIDPEQVVGDIMLAPAAIKRLIEPAEVAELVAYLCGPHAGFITGSSLVMDGGWTAH